MDITEKLGDLLHAVLITSRGQWVLRLVTLLTGALAATLSIVWFPVVIWPLYAIVVGGLLTWVLIQPDSMAALIMIAVVALWWLLVGPTAWWQALVLAAVLGAFHLGVAWSAAAPSASRLPTPDLARLGLVLLGFLAVTGAFVAVILGVAAVPEGVVPRGFPWIALAGAAVLGLGTVVLTRLPKGRR